jgi:hypothetical protein
LNNHHTPNVTLSHPKSTETAPPQTSETEIATEIEIATDIATEIETEIPNANKATLTPTTKVSQPRLLTKPLPLSSNLQNHPPTH